MSCAFTPGVWMNTGAVGFALFIASAEARIAMVYGPKENNCAVANANLMAAAPDLYKACTEVLPYLEEHVASVIEAHSVLDEAGDPIPETLERDVDIALERERRLLALLRWAIAYAECGLVDSMGMRRPI
jgi:hypothetical protein